MNKATQKSSNLAESREQLVEDLQRLIGDAQALAKEAKTASGQAIEEKVQAARDALRDGVDNLKRHGEVVREKAIEQSKGVDELVRENPWKSIGIAALGGFVVSLLLRKH
ncbi:MAG: YqjD family protein [Puniceicoccaceae bacterium]